MNYAEQEAMIEGLVAAHTAVMERRRERLAKWRSSRNATGTHAMHAHGQGKGRGKYDPGNPKARTYRVRGLRP